MPDMIPGLKKLIKFDAARMSRYHDLSGQVLQKLNDLLHRDRRLGVTLEERVEHVVEK
jgi:hypothetical protein